MTDVSSGLPARNKWSHYWGGLDWIVRGTAFLRSAFRKHFIATTVGRVVNLAIPAEGVFLHGGSGSAESDILIGRLSRKFVALDFVKEPLLVARTQPNSYRCVMGDLKKLPICNGSIDGIWNVGVHEHFTPAENCVIFGEFFRILKPGGKLIVFWPAKYTPYMAIKTAFENVFRIFRKGFTFFPDEVNKALSREHVRGELENSGFRVRSITISPRDLYIFFSVVAEKPTKLP